MKQNSVVFVLLFSFLAFSFYPVEAMPRDGIERPQKDVTQDKLCSDIRLLFKSGKWMKSSISPMPLEKKRGVRYAFDLDLDGNPDYLEAEYPDAGIYSAEPKYTLLLSKGKKKNVFYGYGRESFVKYNGKHYLVFSVIGKHNNKIRFTNPLSIIEISGDEQIVINCRGEK